MLSPSFISKLLGVEVVNPSGKIIVVVSPAFTVLLGNLYSAYILNASNAPTALPLLKGLPFPSVIQAFVITLVDSSSAFTLLLNGNVIEKTL